MDLEEAGAETKRKLSQICGEYLSAVWVEVGEDDVICKLMSVGLANKTYYCSISNCEIPEKHKDVNPKEVVIHVHGSGIFGDKNAMKFNGEAAEVIIIHLLSQLGMCPKLYGVFEGGRIEEYIPSKVATVDDLKSLELSKAVVRKLAKIHSLLLPISKKPNLLDKMRGVMQSGGRPTLDVLRNRYNEEELMLIQKILNFEVVHEMNWIESVIPMINHRVICSQNDMSNNNVLLKNNYTSIDDIVMIIDFEMCGYFYRGYDIAYFLRMRKSRLGRTKNGKVFLTEEAVDESENDCILDEYLKTFSNITGECDPKYDTVDHLKMELALFDLLYDCMIIGYTLVVVKNSAAVVEYTESLVNKYEAKKVAFIKKYGDVFERKN